MLAAGPGIGVLIGFVAIGLPFAIARAFRWRRTGRGLDDPVRDAYTGRGAYLAEGDLLDRRREAGHQG